MIIIFIGMTLLLALIDIAVKFYIEASVKAGEEHRLCKGRIRIRKVHNKGMALNMLENKPEIVKGVGVAAAMLLTIYQLFTFMRRGRYMQKAGLSLMAGGAWSNTLDRAARGYVVDYVGFQTKWERFTRITYNLGDLFIFTGALIMMFSSLFRTKKKSV